jgi:type II secretory pathway pseudopilin PulG
MRLNGFSLAEQLVIVVILGIMASIAIPSFLFVLRRERVNAVALEAAGWLEEVRTAAAREVSADPTQGGCGIVLAGTLSNVGEGAPIASTTCSVRNPVLRIPDVQGALLDIATSVPAGNVTSPPSPEACSIAGSNFCGAGAFQINFSPRGMWSTQSVSGVLTDIEIRIVLDGGAGPKRCVRLSSILGSMDIGSSAEGGLGLACSGYGRI